MGLEKLVGMQLFLMQPSEVEVTANILKKAHSSWEEVSVSFYDAEILPRLVESLRQKELVVVAKLDGAIVAAYDLPAFFAREEGKIAFGQTVYEGALGMIGYVGVDDYFAVRDPGLGVGTAFFSLLERVLEYAAFETGLPIVHRGKATHRSKVFFEKKCGYDEVQVTPGLHVDIHTMERTYKPRKHDLLQNEGPIVDALLSVMHQSAVPLPVTTAQQTI